MMQSTDVKLSDMQPGPIPHAELPPELTERIMAFKAILGYVDRARWNRQPTTSNAICTPSPRSRSGSGSRARTRR
jgi:hypothetical protein